MKVYAEMLVFGAIAISVHAAGFWVAPETGEDGGGQQGEMMLSLHGVTPQIEAMVADWTRPPDVQADQPAPVSSPVQTVQTAPAPPLEVSQFAPVQLQAPEAAQADDPARETPSINTHSAPQLPKVDPPPKVRPKPRPVPKQATKVKPKPKKTAAKAQPEQAPKTARKAQKAQDAQQQQKAAGAGSTQTAGTRGKAKVKSGNAKSAARALDVWGAQVRRAIERRKRPVRGLKRRAALVLEVTVAANGQVLSYRIVKSSGNGKADKAALRAVNGVRTPPAVQGVAVSKHSFRIPMLFNP
ncbi:TonB family protein [Neptunicoccus sediminis]|uniref:TonB family protein n=1 Tax=Neptunicoccus sediminis TaxID=1892596 RepID=UPI000845BE92|nr:TonB family protein [Neptunicoccus sediminis]